MYNMLGNELNLWIGVILFMGRLGQVIPGHIRLGNWPHPCNQFIIGVFLFGEG